MAGELCEGFGEGLGTGRPLLAFHLAATARTLACTRTPVTICFALSEQKDMALHMPLAQRPASSLL
eukprot:5727621-Pyramimonas_sp.AAC.1